MVAICYSYVDLACFGQANNLCAKLVWLEGRTMESYSCDIEILGGRDG